MLILVLPQCHVAANVKRARTDAAREDVIEAVRKKLLAQSKKKKGMSDPMAIILREENGKHGLGAYVVSCDTCMPGHCRSNNMNVMVDTIVKQC